MERLKGIIIAPQVTIRQALQQMEQRGEKTLLIVNNKGQLAGTVTDGDIRRWILKRRSLAKTVTSVMNRKPIVLKDGYSREEAKKIMLAKVIECLPVVGENMKLTSAVLWIDLFEGSLKKHKQIDASVVIMAGGEGSRLTPFTNILPKPLIPIGNKPIIELIIDRFKEYGCRRFYLSVNYKANILKAYLSERKSNDSISYIQEDKPLGTIGSLYLLKDKIKDTFFVSNCDILIEADYADILKFHKINQNSITLVVSLKHFTIPYGICEIENGGCLKLIKEKPEYDFLVNTGMYVMNKETLDDIPMNSFYNAVDLINDYIARNNRIGIYPVTEKSWLDMGQWEELHETLKRFGEK